MRRTRCCYGKKDFDAWAYNIVYEPRRELLPLFSAVSLTAEDIKFAYNAWSFLRLSLFFGTEKPKVLSGLHDTRPSMDIALGGNRLFFMNAHVNGSLSLRRRKIALTPCHPHAQSLQAFDWQSAMHAGDESSGTRLDGVELVVGMENGLSQRVVDDCDHCVYIPQYGSIGSLSMISALAIATHAAHTTHYCGWKSPAALISAGHMPESNAPQTRKGERKPHEISLLTLTNEEVKAVLHERRARYPLQIGVLLYNELGDRNISAVMRNANAFNAEQFIVLNRRKFNRRGAVGTQHLLNVSFASTIADTTCQRCLEGYAVWLLYPYYPYLLVYTSESDSSRQGDERTFLRPDDLHLAAWSQSGHRLDRTHPLVSQFPHLAGTDVYLDDVHSLEAAVRDVADKGFRGIMVAVPEEGASPHPSLARASSRVLFVNHPDRLATVTQRGLNPALSTAIAFERLRSAIDTLACAAPPSPVSHGL